MWSSDKDNKRNWFVVATLGGFLAVVFCVTLVGIAIDGNKTGSEDVIEFDPTWIGVIEDVESGSQTYPAGKAPLIQVRPTSLIQPKSLANRQIDLRPTWTATPLNEGTPTPKPTLQPTFVSENLGQGVINSLRLIPGEKWIDVNLTSQTLVAYEGAAPVFKSLVSSGTARHPTVTGQFRIWLRFQSQTMDGRRLGYDYYLKGVPFVQYFYEDYALHGTYWHNNFGTPMSHGCVNLPTPAAEWLYNWADYGMLVNIHK